MNAPTRAAFERILIDRTESVLAKMQLPTTVDGSNAILTDPLTVAIQTCGTEPGTYGEIADSDFEFITTGALAQKVADIAEYRLLCTLQTRWMEVTFRVGTQSEVDWSDVMKNLAKRTEAIRAELATKYGIGLAGLVPGIIRLNNVSKNPCLTRKLHPRGY